MINLDDIFSYMDLRDNFSEEEISHAFLDPMREEAEARFKEEAAKLSDLLRTRLETRVKEDHGSLDHVAGTVDIAALAREEIQARQASLLELEEKRRTLEGILGEHNQELKESHGRHEHLTGAFRGLQMQLKNTPAEPRWINRTELANRAAEQLERAPDTRKSLQFSKLAMRSELEAEQEESKKALIRYQARREEIQKVVRETIEYLSKAQGK